MDSNIDTTEAVKTKESLTIKDVIIAPDARLRTVAERVKEVTVVEQDLIDEMIKTMKASDGLGLAATQLGINKRVIVVDVEPLEAYDDNDPSTIKHGKFEMVNPTIISRQGRARWVEGCLSVPGYKDIIERDLIIDVHYSDRYGNAKELKASGLLSACIQHEIDHLDGKLFVDRLSRLKKNMVMAKLKKFRRRGVMVVKPSAGSVF